MPSFTSAFRRIFRRDAPIEPTAQATLAILPPNPNEVIQTATPIPRSANIAEATVVSGLPPEGTPLPRVRRVGDVEASLLSPISLIEFIEEIRRINVAVAGYPYELPNHQRFRELVRSAEGRRELFIRYITSPFATLRTQGGIVESPTKSVVRFYINYVYTAGEIPSVQNTIIPEADIFTGN